MIVKARSRTDGAALGNYLLSQGSYAKNRDENERIAVWEGPGLAEGVALQTLLRSYQWSAANTNCAKPLYHMQMRSAPGEHLTQQQWLYAIDKTEGRLGLTGHDRVIVAHTKAGQEHVHVVWNRIDYERGKAAALSYDARKRLDVARELEHELGLRTLGNERGGKLSAKEEAFCHRHGKAPQQMKAILQTAWDHADNGHEFLANLDAHGMILAKGDTRGFLAVDREGDFYLVSRVTGSKEKEVREKFSDLDREQLPTLDQARAQHKERVREQEAERVMPDTQITHVVEEALSPPQAALEIAPLQVENALRIADLEAELQEVNAIIQQHEPTQQPTAVQAPEAQREQTPQPQAPQPTATPRDEPTLEKTVADAGKVADKGIMVASNIAGRAASGLLDAVSNFLDLFAGKPQPRKISTSEMLQSAEARKEYNAQQHAQQGALQQRNEALDRISEQLKKGQHIEHAAVGALSYSDLQQIKDKGDDGLRALVRQREAENQLSYSFGNLGRKRDR